MNDCPRFGKLFGGCKFEARYDEGAAKFSGDFKTHSTEDTRVMCEALRSKTYVHDICIRCGKTVKRS